MAAKTALAVSDALYLKPLLHGLTASSSPFSLAVDIPAQNALKFAQRSGDIRCAFLSPLDYARHGGEFRIVPGIAVSSSQPTDTIRLFVNSDVRNIHSLAVDIRMTSEIILAKIILSEKYRNASIKDVRFQVIAMLPNVDLMLQKADAALVVNLQPTVETSDKFPLDLVEEWNDLTELPYVHGFWVAREGDLTRDDIQNLLDAKQKGVEEIVTIAEDAALHPKASKETALTYLSSFSWELGATEQESVSEFFRYSFFYGALADIPDLNFFETSPSSERRESP
ncbi:MAG: hypothetical protein HYY49_13670 [Ignavibacteriales bacterium]|nr:hypothetical protein [Ignavibacteriales bacterium]